MAKRIASLGSRFRLRMTMRTYPRTITHSHHTKSGALLTMGRSPRTNNTSIREQKMRCPQHSKAPEKHESEFLWPETSGKS